MAARGKQQKANAVSCALSHISHLSFAPNADYLKLLIDKMKVSVTYRENIHIADHELHRSNALPS